MYKALSNYYDLFMQDVDYSKWADFVCTFLKDCKEGADLACGSGLFTLELKKRGFDVVGVDISQSMLNKAVQNSLNARQKIDFVKGDMASVKFFRPLEFVTAICDGINYLKNPLKAFLNIYSQLKDGGIFIFDISSEHKLRNVLANSTFSDTQDDITYIWRSSLNKAKNCLCHDLTFFERVDKLYKRSYEQQIQYIHSTDSILKMLKEAGFHAQAMALSNDNKPKKLDQNDMRIYFVAKKSN